MREPLAVPCTTSARSGSGWEWSNRPRRRTAGAWRSGGSSPTYRPRTRKCVTGRRRPLTAWVTSSWPMGDWRRPRTRTAACRDAAQKLPGVPSGAPNYRALLAQAHGDLGRVHYELNQFRNAEMELGQAIPILEKLVSEDPQNQDARAKLGANLNYLGGILFGTSRYQEAEAVFRRVIDHRQVLLDQSPRSVDDQSDQASSLANLGTIYAITHRFPEAEATYRRALAIRRRLADDCAPRRCERRTSGVPFEHHAA